MAEVEFPDKDWVDFYRDQHQFPAPPEFDFIDRGMLDLPPPGEIAYGDECARLLALKPLRGQRMREIRQQAQSEKHAIQPVFDVLNIRIDRPVVPQAMRWRQIIQDNIWAPIFIFKREFMRGRPWNRCDLAKLDPLLQRPDRLYPGHPSYPSGHATMAYTWAHLLTAVVPAARTRLEQAAFEVAYNREVAGVHFPSDSEAGRRLAEQMATVMLKDERLNDFKRVFKTLA
jgi:acid phosphatase (class A)